MRPRAVTLRMKQRHWVRVMIRGKWRKEGKMHSQGSGWNEWVSYVGIAVVQSTEGGFQF